MSMGGNAQGQLGDGSGKNQWVPQLINKDAPEFTSVRAACHFISMHAAKVCFHSLQPENTKIDDPVEFLLGRDLRVLAAGKAHCVAVAVGYAQLLTEYNGASD